MKIKISAFILATLLTFSLSACDSGVATTTTDASQQQREVYTYLDVDFSQLEVGDDLEETGIFQLYEGAGFAASSKDEDGTVWVQCRDIWTGTCWGLAYTDIYKDGEKVFLKDFCVQFDTRIPNTDGVPMEISPDGGACILRSPSGPRYDLALRAETASNGAAHEGTHLDLWLATVTDDGPWATTQELEEWGDRGSVVRDFTFSPNVTYTVTICGKYQGMNEAGEEFFTLYVFIDEYLVIYQRDIPWWEGGFGIRGGYSNWEYANFKVSDFPLVCPDGIDHYTVDDENTEYSEEAYEKMTAPTLKVNGTTVSWNAVDEAQGYNIYCDGKLVRYVETTSIDVSELGVESALIEICATPNRFGLNASEKASVQIGSSVDGETGQQ